MVFIFSPNCTLPPPATPIYVGSPNVRSTSTILISCLTLLIFSTWEVQHLTVPAPGPNGSVARKLRLFWRRLQATLIAILYPEWLCGRALYESRINRRILLESGHMIAANWTLAHVFLANMGGFAIVFETDNQQPISDSLKPQVVSGPEQAQTNVYNTLFTSHSTNSIRTRAAASNLSPRSSRRRMFWQYILNMVSMPDDRREKNIRALQTNTWVLTAQQLHKACDLGIIKELPKVHDEELDDLNKGTGLGKVIIIGQFVWLLVQMCARLYEHSTISQMELCVFGYGICTIITYILAWQKPQDVQSFKIIHAQRTASADEICDIAELGPRPLLPTSRKYTIPESWFTPHFDHESQPISCYAWFTGFMLAGWMFAGLHLIAWFAPFPTKIEKSLWQYSVVLMNFWHVFILFFRVAFKKDNSSSSRSYDVFDNDDWTDNLFYWVLGIVQTLARLYLFVEMFRALLYLPAEAFHSTWAANIPHIG